MRSNPILSIICGLTLATAGCGIQLGQKAPGPYEMKPSPSQYTCVSQIAERMEDYINARMGDDDIASFVDCLQRAFFLFDQTFHGHQVRGYFAPNEIRTFIENNFLPADRKISDELLSQFMVIKQTLVGGDVDKISHSDLSAANEILGQIRDEAIRLRPFVSVLNPGLVKDEDPATIGPRLIQASQALDTSIQVIGNLLSRSQHPYSFKNLRSFANEFKRFVQWDKLFPASLPIEDWVELLTAFKQAAVSPGDQEVAAQEWIPLLDAGFRWYLSYIRFEVGVSGHTIFAGNGFKNTVALMDDAQDLLNQAVKQQPNQMVSFAVVDRFIAALKQVDWLPREIHAESVQSVVHVLVNKILGGSDGAPVKSGITKLTLARLSSLLSQWQEIQLGILENYPSLPGSRDLLKEAPLIGLANLLKEPHQNRSGWTDFILKFKDSRGLFQAGSNRVFLARTADLPASGDNAFNLSRMNLLNSIIRMIYDGYGNGDVMTQDQLQRFYEDAKSMGIDLDLMDARVDDAGTRTYLEAKIFTYLGDGEVDASSRLHFDQALQEAAFLYSGGMLGRDLYIDLQNHCPMGAWSQSAYPTLDRGCVTRELVASLLRLVHTMPAYIQFLKGLDPEQRLIYADAVIGASRKFSRPSDVEKTEFATMATVIHYSEAVMTNFDKDGNSFLDEDEINTAAPRFTGFISKISNDLCISDPTPKNAFKFILKYDRLPTSNFDYMEIMKNWVEDLAGNHDTWILRMDRLDIARVFVALVHEMSGPPSQGCPEAPEPTGF